MTRVLPRAYSIAIINKLLHSIAVPAVIGFLLLISYFPGLRSYFLSDDYVLLSEALLNRSVLSVFRVEPQWWFYRPLGKLLWLAMYHVFGYHAFFYHLASLTLHWINSVLVVVIVRRFSRRSTALAFTAGTLFALFPLQVEAVVWLASQYDLLATGAYLATLLYLLIAWQRRDYRLYVLSLGTYQLSLWSKEISFTLPLLVLMCALILPERPRLGTIFVSILPYTALLSINLLQRYYTWGSIGGYSNLPLAGSSLWDKLKITLTMVLAPLNQLLFPKTVVQVWLFLMAMIIILGFILVSSQKSEERVRYLVLIWVVVTCIPVFNILPIGYDLQNSRVLYLPSVGICIGLAASLETITKRILPRAHQYALLGGSALLCGAYIIVLTIQIQPWVTAGRESIHVVQELHRFIPTFAPGSRVQIAGLPDNYKGAYVYRLGLNHSFGHHYQGTFALEAVEQLPALNYDQPGDIIQVAFIFDEATRQWQIVRARSVMHDDTVQLAPASQRKRWNFVDCEQAGQWERDQTQVSCIPGNGVFLPAFSENDALVSPSLNLSATGWSEVSVSMIVPKEAQSRGAAQLFWITEPGQEWSKDRSAVINLPSDGTHRNYHFFIPPDRTQKPLSRLQLTIKGMHASVLLKSLTIRAIP